MDTLRIIDVGDTAFSIEFGDGIDPVTNGRVMGLRQAVLEEMAQGHLTGLVETVPSFRALLIQYDPLQTCRSDLEGQIRTLAATCGQGQDGKGRTWTIPVCYDADLGEDLDELAQSAGIPRQQVMDLHMQAEFRVYMLGFMPGFAYLGGLPPLLRRPRRAAPRLKVPAGSVAVADALCAVYPWESPGGWHLIGRTPVKFFDLERQPTILLAPGDLVRFRAVSRAWFDAARHDPDMVSPNRLLTEVA